MPTYNMRNCRYFYSVAFRFQLSIKLLYLNKIIIYILCKKNLKLQINRIEIFNFPDRYMSIGFLNFLFPCRHRASSDFQNL